MDQKEKKFMNKQKLKKMFLKEVEAFKPNSVKKLLNIKKF